MKENFVLELIENHGLPLSRLISSSKSYYRKKNPDNLIVFNANILSENGIKVWHGDLDITKDGVILSKIAKEAGVVLFVLTEMDARFGRENAYVDAGFDALRSVCVWDTKQEIPQ